jgi:hypothetical protein
VGVFPCRHLKGTFFVRLARDRYRASDGMVTCRMRRNSGLALELYAVHGGQLSKGPIVSQGRRIDLRCSIGSVAHGAIPSALTKESSETGQDTIHPVPRRIALRLRELVLSLSYTRYGCHCSNPVRRYNHLLRSRTLPLSSRALFWYRNDYRKSNQVCLRCRWCACTSQQAGSRESRRGRRWRKSRMQSRTVGGILGNGNGRAPKVEERVL